MKKVVLLFVLCLPVVLQAHPSWRSKSAKLEEARNAVVNEKFIEAVELYAELTKGNGGGKSTDGDLLSEYAYALALSHNFDFALLTIDRARMHKSKYGDFYTNQILEIMGLPQLASYFPFKETPGWLIADYKSLRSSCSVTYSKESRVPRSELERAYELLSQKQYVRSIIILYKLEQVYPEAYAVSLVNSYAWECIGNTERAALYLEKAIQTMGNNETAEKKVVYAQHLNDLRSHRSHQSSGLSKKFDPRLLTFIGASGTNGMVSLNGRVGFYTNSFFSTSMNLSMTRGNGQYSGNIGMSAYQTWRIFMAGLGVSYQFGGENKAFNLAPSAGLTFLSDTGKSSLDILFNCFIPFTSKGEFSYGITIGKTFYL